ncbi:MAG: general secretion pathway protein GspK, partial [Alphaproteobacteria bacterium]|nr:general secretion pathway protein GspK [Alphaproteobacteria bacterium]
MLIGFITIHITATGRTEVRIATNLAANAAAQAAADGAVFEAIFNLSLPQPDRHWMADGQAHELQIGDSRIVVRVEDEAGRINPNLAAPVLLEGLLRGVGSEPEKAADLAAAISEWVGSVQVTRTPEELLTEYRAAGFDYGPPVSPLESMDGLDRVRGMTPTLLAAMLPHVSLFSPAQPDPAHADPIVAAAIAFAEGGRVQAGRQRAPNDADGGPVTVRIKAIARGPHDAEATRMA